MKTPTKVMDNPQTEPFFQVALSTTCVVFRFDAGELQILLVRRNQPPGASEWALPGTLVEPDADVETTAYELIEATTGQMPQEMHQARAFTAPERHPAGRVVNVAYYCMLGSGGENPSPPEFAETAAWFPENVLPELILDHGQVLAAARKRLKKRMRRHPVAFRLLPEHFTMNDLQDLYEQIFEQSLDRRNFRKKVQLSTLVRDTGELKMRGGGQGRSAKLYYFDWVAYANRREEMFHFDL